MTLAPITHHEEDTFEKASNPLAWVLGILAFLSLCVLCIIKFTLLGLKWCITQMVIPLLVGGIIGYLGFILYLFY